MSTSPDRGAPAVAVRELALPRLVARGATQPASAQVLAEAAATPPDDPAFAAGFAAGYAQGLRRASEDTAREAEARRRSDERAAAERTAATARATRSLAARAAELAVSTDELLAVLADALVEGAVTIARAVVAAELSEPGHRAASALRRAVAAAAGDAAAPARVTVRLHPDDVRALDVDALPDEVSVTADPSLRPGDAQATTGARWVDARVGEALDRAAREVLA